MNASDTILVTGGTGTLGRELVPRLAGDGARVVVLTRNAPEGSAPGRSAPGGPGADGVELVRGDPRAGAGLGLAPAARARLEAEVTGILHCAAATTFTLPLEEARSANVAGTAGVLAFARRCRRLERVGCFSTVYVAGRLTGDFGEDDVGSEAAGFVNPYERSKHEMEEVVRARRGELPIALYRLSTVAGDSRTGAVTGYNAFHHSLRLLYQGLVPMVPGDPAAPVDLVGVDYAAEAAHWLFRHRFVPGRTYHLCAGAGAAPLGALLDATVEGFRRWRPAWRKRAVERPAVADLATYELFVRSVEEAGNEVLRRATRSVQSFVHQLAHPKRFLEDATGRELAGSGLRARPVLEWYDRVVRYCVEDSWGTAAA